ncbi:hypothetical protein HDU90_004281 [Geranomyces variabilis]|nr:hypothetical protein HDU90_004281 [Geranomyces variabilis]
MPSTGPAALRASVTDVSAALMCFSRYLKLGSPAEVRSFGELAARRTLTADARPDSSSSESLGFLDVAATCHVCEPPRPKNGRQRDLRSEPSLQLVLEDDGQKGITAQRKEVSAFI